MILNVLKGLFNSALGIAPGIKGSNVLFVRPERAV